MYNTQHTPGRTFEQIGRDLTAIRKLARLEKKELGGVTPKTAARARALFLESEAVCAIDDAITSGQLAAIAKTAGSAS
jgi:hypothetical protein